MRVCVFACVFASVVVCVSVCLFARACATTYPVTVLPNSGSPVTPPTSHMTKPHVHPPRGATVAVMSSGGSTGIIDWVVNRHRQSYSTTTTTVRAAAPTPSPPPHLITPRHITPHHTSPQGCCHHHNH